MLSDKVKRVITLTISMFGPEEHRVATAEGPAFVLKPIREAFIDSGRFELATSIDENQQEAEQLIAALLGMM